MLGYGCVRDILRGHGQAVHSLMRGMHCRVELIHSTGNAPILTTVQRVLNTLHDSLLRTQVLRFSVPPVFGESNTPYCKRLQ